MYIVELLVEALYDCQGTNVVAVVVLFLLTIFCPKVSNCHCLLIFISVIVSTSYWQKIGNCQQLLATVTAS